MTNLPADVLQNYTKSLLEKEETVQNLVERATEDKVIEWLKANVTVVEQDIESKAFNDLMSEHSNTHHEEVEDETEATDASEE